MRVNAGRALLILGQRGHERDAQLDAVGEDTAKSGMRTGVDLIRLGTQEDRRKGHAAVYDQAVDRAVVAV